MFHRSEKIVYQIILLGTQCNKSVKVKLDHDNVRSLIALRRKRILILLKLITTLIKIIGINI